MTSHNAKLPSHAPIYVADGMGHFRQTSARLDAEMRHIARTSGDTEVAVRLGALRRESVALETSLREGLAEARRSEIRMWNALQETSDSFALFDASRRLELVNRAFLTRLGADSVDLSRISFEQFLTRLDEAGAAPCPTQDDPGNWRDQMSAAWESHGVHWVRLAFASGRVMELSVRRLTGGGLVLVGRDETDLSRLSTAIEALPDGFALFDPQDRLVISNAAYRQLYATSSAVIRPGISFADILRHRLSKGQYPEAEGREEAWLAERLAYHYNPDGRPIEEVLPDGRIVRVLERQMPDGSRVGLRLDITDEKRRAEEFAAAKMGAEAAAEAKSKFLSTMSHEIRTPLNGIISLADTMLDEALDPDTRRTVAAIRDSGSALLALLTDVLELSALKSGTADLAEQPFDPAEVTRAVIDGFRAEAERKRIDLTVTTADDLPALIMGDPARLRRVVAKIVSNAVRFTNSGGVVGRVEMQGPEKLRITITDTGLGIPLGMVDHVMRSFTQVSESMDRSHDGGGIGLAIAARSLHLMSGELRIEQAESGGTRMVLELPAHRPPEEETVQEDPDAGAPMPLDVAAAEPAKPRVLAAEDNPTNRLVLSKLLEPLEIDLVFAEDGFDAVALARQIDPQLILMDISMPGMDGKEATDQIRTWEAEAKRPPVRIVAMTAHAMPGDSEEFLAAGLDAYLPKPLKREKLFEEISRLSA